MLSAEYRGTPPASWKFALSELQAVYESLDQKEEISLLAEEKEGIEEQGYYIRKEQKQIYLEGGGESGVFYGVLDLAAFLRHHNGELNKFKESRVTPYLKKRGIKFNIPLDARTPSYSDASDNAYENIPYVWEKSFWRDYLDQMALQKYNVLSLWSLSPFPSLVKNEKYPLASLSDVKRSVIGPKAEMSGRGMFAPDMENGLVTVKRMTIEEKIAFWQWVMEYAKARCIEIYLFTWNLFVYGTEHSPYGITEDQKNPVTEDYLYHAVCSCLDTYPLLAGLGITSGENMIGDESDILFLRNTYGRAVEDHLKQHPERKIRLIHRMQYARFQEMQSCYEGFKGTFEISFKYSQAHMYSSVKPMFFNDFLKKMGGKAEQMRYWMTLRDDDYYLYRFGGVSYVRAYLEHLPCAQMEGFYMGADGYTWGKDFAGIQETEHPLYLKKMWYKFMIWGQLSYNKDISDRYFKLELQDRFGPCGNELFEVWQQASAVIPLVNQIHWHDYDFQWYPEGCCMYLHPPVGKLVFASIREFVECEAMPGSGCLSVKEYCRSIMNGKKQQGENPAQAARELEEISRKVLDFVEKMGRRRKRKEPGYSYNAELSCWEDRTRILEDLKLLGLLAQYYSYKFLGALSLCFACMKETNAGEREFYRKQAKEYTRKSAESWRAYSKAWSLRYRGQRLNRLCSYVDFQAFDRLADADSELVDEMIDQCSQF